MKHFYIYLYTLFLFCHCIYANIDPPSPESLNKLITTLKIQARAQALTPLLIRYWDRHSLINLPLSENHRVDNFGSYLNILPVADDSKNYSIWIFFDENQDGMIASHDRAFSQVNIQIPSGINNIDLFLTRSESQMLAQASPTGTLPTEKGMYYCFFKPESLQGDSITLSNGVRFTDWRPFASWEKKSVPFAHNVKQAYLPVLSSSIRFTGLCVFDRNQNEKFDQSETIFQVPSFQISPSGVYRFTVTSR